MLALERDSQLFLKKMLSSLLLSMLFSLPSWHSSANVLCLIKSSFVLKTKAVLCVLQCCQIISLDLVVNIDVSLHIYTPTLLVPGGRAVGLLSLHFYHERPHFYRTIVLSIYLHCVLAVTLGPIVSSLVWERVLLGT